MSKLVISIAYLLRRFWLLHGMITVTRAHTIAQQSNKANLHLIISMIFMVTLIS